MMDYENSCCFRKNHSRKSNDSLEKILDKIRHVSYHLIIIGDYLQVNGKWSKEE